MRTLLGVSIAAVVLAAAVFPASAATETRYQTAQGSVVCKPTETTASNIKAKATGLRNEGTSNTFVICGFESSNSRDAFGTIQGIDMGMYGLNGASATVSCTAVNGYTGLAPVYATKSVVTAVGGGETILSFDASDFGGVAGDPLPNSDYWSITCLLSGNTAIGRMRTKFQVSVPAA